MILRFEGEAIWWKGPAPWVFVPVPPYLSAEIQAVSSRVSYGWGCIPAHVTIGGTRYYTALFPKDGVYLVPVKAKVQRAEGVKVGDAVLVTLEIGGAA